MIKNLPDIALVKYLNTKPFYHGLQKYWPDKKLRLLPPAECMSAFMKKQVEVALVPVGALHDINDRRYRRLKNFCISSEGPVKTVLWASDTEKELWHTLYLDSHSRTSSLLSRLLLKKQVDYKVLKITDKPQLQKGEAILLIGDKVFQYRDAFKYHYDLGELWLDLFELPMTFAVWIAEPDISQECLEVVEKALKEGLKNRDKLLPPSYLSDEEFKQYIYKDISYTWNDAKEKSLQLFLEKTKNITIQIPEYVAKNPPGNTGTEKNR